MPSFASSPVSAPSSLAPASPSAPASGAASPSSSSSSSSPPTSSPRAGARARRPTGTWIALAGWVAVGGAAAAGDLLHHLPERALPLVIWTPVLAALGAWRLIPSFRRGLATLNVRAIVLLHGIRTIVGAAFVVQASRGVLPDAFGRPVGWGDVVAGLLAIVVAAAARPDRRGGRRLLLAWNTLGFLDILMAFVSAQRLVFFVHDPRMAAGLGRLPFSLIPLLLVPFVIASHLWLFHRLQRPGDAAASAPSNRRVSGAA